MFHKVSPEPMENSSGYVSNTNSMNPPPVKYATIGRNRPGGVKRTTSVLVNQPVVPPQRPPVKLAPAPHKDARRHYKNDLSRPSSRASRSSANSDTRRPSSRSSRDAPSDRLNRHHRTGSRRSYSKVRRPESRTSSKALILRRKGSGRRGGAGAKRTASVRSGRSDEQRNSRPSSRASQTSQKSSPRREPERTKSSIFSWKPRLTLRRSKSLQVKPEQAKKREIRFGDELQPEVIMMKGVEHRRRPDSETKQHSDKAAKYHTPASSSAGTRVSQTLTRPPKRTGPPSRSQRASSVDVSKRLAPVGESAQEEDSPPRSPRARRYQRHDEGRSRPSSVSPGQRRAPSEVSSSPPPRAPVWRDDSDASDTVTNRSVDSTVRSSRQADQHTRGQQRSSRSQQQESPPQRRRSAEKSSVLNFLRRTFSIKPKEKPAKLVKKRERASSSSLSSLERPVRHSKMKTAKSHEILNVTDAESLEEANKYRSLPRNKQSQHSSGTALSRRLSSLGWPAAGGRPRPKRSRSFKDEREYVPRNNNSAGSRRDTDSWPKNNERVMPTHHPAAPKTVNETAHGHQQTDESPIRPILQERRALSQPSLYHPAPVDPSDEPFSHYANLPYQVPPRRRSSPNLLADGETTTAPRAHPPPRADSPHSSDSSATINANERHTDNNGVGRKRPPAKSILKQQKSEELKNTNIIKDEPKQRSNVLQDLAHNIKNVFRHRKSGEKPTAGEAHAASAADPTVSERFVNVTSTHEETESAREEEELHPLGGISHQDLSRAIRDGVDARELIRPSSGRPQAGGAERRGGIQRRLLHQSGKTWRTVDADDTHETSRRDRHGDLVTESAYTHQREEYHNLQVPDDGAELPEAGVQQARSSSHTRRHTKDVDMLEHFSVPRGGRLGDGIRLGDPLRYTQENVEGEYSGDPGVGGVSERMRDQRHVDLRPNGRTTTSIEYPAEAKVKKHHTSSWLNDHFGSESGNSRASDEDRRQWCRSGYDERERRPGDPQRLREDSDRRSEDPDRRHRDTRRQQEPGRHRETSTYEYQRSSGTTQKGTSPPKSWGRSEKYEQEVRETPQKTYVRETHYSSDGRGHNRERSASENRHELISDLQSEVDEDPIFASKFSCGKSRGPQRAGVAFGNYMANKPEPLSPPTRRVSPPAKEPRAPSPPPRHKRKNRLKKSPPPAVLPQSVPSELVDPNRASRSGADLRREQHEPAQRAASHRVRRDVTPSRPDTARRTTAPETVTSSPNRKDGRLVREYHFRSSESPRDGTPVYREYRESDSSPQRPARRGSSSARESPPKATTYFGQRDVNLSTEEPDSHREDKRYTGTLKTNMGVGENRRVQRGSDELDRRSAEPTYRSFTVDRRLGKTAHQAATQDALQSQTLPRNPRGAREPSTTTSRNSRLASPNGFGGSMINVSVKNNIRGDRVAPRKPDRSPVRRSNSLYSKEGQPSTPPVSAGLKSPNILSQIQRTASMRRGSVDDPRPPPSPSTPVAPRMSPMRAFEAERHRNEENEMRSSLDRTHVIPVSITPPADDPSRPPSSPSTKVPPKVAPKPQQGVLKDKFMRGLMQTAPELYSALHKDERKDSKTPSPKQSPPLTPPPPLQRARSPQPMPLDYGVIYPKTPPVFKRIEALRADEEVVTKDGRSRSTTPAEDVANFRLGTMSPSGERNDVIKVSSGTASPYKTSHDEQCHNY